MIEAVYPSLKVGDVCEVTQTAWCPVIAEEVFSDVPFEALRHLSTENVLMHSGDVITVVKLIDNGKHALFRILGRPLIIWTKRLKLSEVRLS